MMLLLDCTSLLEVEGKLWLTGIIDLNSYDSSLYKIKSARLCDVLEVDKEMIDVSKDGHSFELKYQPFQVITVKLSFE